MAHGTSWPQKDAKNRYWQSIAIMETINENIQQEGFSIVQHFFDDSYIDEVIKELEEHEAFQYDNKVASSTNLLLSIPFLNNLAHSRQLTTNVEEVLGNNSFPLNAFVLDKTQSNNWELDWHQDLQVAVKNKIETTGYNNWSVECGIVHVIPPRDVLAKLISVRIHLDDCCIDNGAILVAPKSHQYGIVRNRKEIEEVISGHTVCCEVERGGVMFLSSLLLHKSPYAITNKRRRILQIDYAGTELSNGLQWYY